MCISVPAKVLQVSEQAAVVETQGVQRDVLLAVDGVESGGWVLVYGGIAIARLSAEEAQETLALLAKLAPAGNHSP